MAAMQNVGRTIRRNGSEIGGGVVGVGAPVALREFADVRNGQEVSLIEGRGEMLARLTRPSVAWGLGVGGLSGLLWAAGVGPRWLHEFYATHALTSIPIGAVSAAMPVTAGGGGGGGGGTQGTQGTISRSTPSSSSNGEFAPAGGTSPDTQPAQ